MAGQTEKICDEYLDKAMKESVKLAANSSFNQVLTSEAVRSMIRALKTRGNPELKKIAKKYAPDINFLESEGDYYARLEGIVKLAVEFVKIVQFKISDFRKICEGVSNLPSDKARKAREDVEIDSAKANDWGGYEKLRENRIKEYESSGMHGLADIAARSLEYADNQLKLSEGYLSPDIYVKEEQERFGKLFSKCLEGELKNVEPHILVQWTEKVKDFEKQSPKEINDIFDLNKAPPKVAIAVLRAYKRAIKSDGSH